MTERRLYTVNIHWTAEHRIGSAVAQYYKGQTQLALTPRTLLSSNKTKSIRTVSAAFIHIFLVWGHLIIVEGAKTPRWIIWGLGFWDVRGHGDTRGYFMTHQCHSSEVDSRQNYARVHISNLTEFVSSSVTQHFCSVILKSLDLRHFNDDSNTN